LVFIFSELKSRRHVANLFIEPEFMAGVLFISESLEFLALSALLRELRVLLLGVIVGLAQLLLVLLKARDPALLLARQVVLGLLQDPHDVGLQLEGKLRVQL